MQSSCPLHGSLTLLTLISFSLLFICWRGSEKAARRSAALFPSFLSQVFHNAHIYTLCLYISSLVKGSKRRRKSQAFSYPKELHRVGPIPSGSRGSCFGRLCRMLTQAATLLLELGFRTVREPMASALLIMLVSSRHLTTYPRPPGWMIVV